MLFLSWYTLLHKEGIFMPVQLQLDKTVIHFFQQLVQQSGYKQGGTPICYIVVTHTAIDIPEFLKSLEFTGRVGKVIFKSSHHNEEIDAEVESLYPGIIDRTVTKESLKRCPETAIDVVRDTIHADEKCIILDIGGYFAPALRVLSDSSYIRERLLGIVEDTENGHQKYQRNIGGSRVPVCSVARSEQKKTEDYNVGKSIVQSTDAILRRFKKRPENFKCVGVIGFGKIGRSIAHHLRDKNVRRLLVHDREPCISMQAASLDYNITSREGILSGCDLIFCATGNHSLSQEDVELMACDDVHVSSCTSADDEFSLVELEPYFKIDEKDGVKNKIYEKSDGRRVTFLAEGNAVNFALKSNVLGHYIRGVQAAIYLSSLKLCNQMVGLGHIFQLPHCDELFISRLYLQVFNSLQVGTISNFPRMVNDIQSPCRIKALNDLEILFSEQQQVVKFCYLHGPSGLGKSKLSLSYVWGKYATYDLVWQFNHGNYEESVQSLAVKLGVSFLAISPIEIFANIVGYLCERGKRFVFVFRNVEEKGVGELVEVIHRVYKSMPGANGKVFLIGSQPISCLSQMSLVMSPINVEEMKQLTDMNITLSQQRKMCELLGGNFLLVTLACRFLEQKIKYSAMAPHEEVDEYLDRLRLSPDRGASVIQFSLDACNQFKWRDQEVANEIMMMFVFMNPYHIQHFIVLKIREIINIDSHFFDMVTHRLLDYALIEKMKDPSGRIFYAVHPMIKPLLYAINKKTPWIVVKNFRQALSVMEGLFKYDLHNRSLQDSLTYLPHLDVLPHVRTLLSIAQELAGVIGGPIHFHCEIKQATEAKLKFVLGQWLRENKLDCYTRMILIYISDRNAWYFTGQDARGYPVRGYVYDLSNLQEVRKYLSDKPPSDIFGADHDSLQHTLLSRLIPSLGHSESFVNASSGLFCKLGSFFLYQMHNSELSYHYFSAIRKAIKQIAGMCRLTQREGFLLAIATHGIVVSQLNLAKAGVMKDADKLALYSELHKEINDPMVARCVEEIREDGRAEEPACLKLFISDIDKDYLELCSIDMKVALGYIIRYQAVAEKNREETLKLYDRAGRLLECQPTMLSVVESKLKSTDALGLMLRRLRAAIFHAKATHLLCRLSHGACASPARVDLIQKALENLKEALRIRSQHAGDPGVDYARTLSKHGLALLKLHKAQGHSPGQGRSVFRQARADCDKALAIQLRHLPSCHPDIMSTRGILDLIISCQSP
jgi:adenosylhomocysteinase